MILELVFLTQRTSILSLVWSSSSTWNGRGGKIFPSISQTCWSLWFDIHPSQRFDHLDTKWMMQQIICHQSLKHVGHLDSVNLVRYIFLYYIPTGLIVVTSWIFFLLPSTSYPARFSTRFSKDHWKYSDRTALLVTVFLLLINIFSGVVNDTPNTNDGRKNPLILQLFYSFLPISITKPFHLW